MFNEVNRNMMPKKVPNIADSWKAFEEIKKDLKSLEESLDQDISDGLRKQIEEEILQHKHDYILLESYFSILN